MKLRVLNNGIEIRTATSFNEAAESILIEHGYSPGNDNISAIDYLAELQTSHHPVLQDFEIIKDEE